MVRGASKIHVTIEMADDAPLQPGWEEYESAAGNPLLPHTDEWIVYKTTDKREPVVMLRQQGFDGLAQACLVFIGSKSF